MKFSFGWKLGIVISVLSVGLTSLSVYYFYTTTYRMTMAQLGKNLRDVGNVGVMLFDDESREALKRVKQRALSAAQIDSKQIAELPPGATHGSLPAESVDQIHESVDFQLLVHKLRMLTHASYKEAGPVQDAYGMEIAGLKQGMVGAYIMTDLKDYPRLEVIMYLAAAGYAPLPGGWPGNPVGNITRSVLPFFAGFFTETCFYDHPVEDDYYQCITVTVPIFDRVGTFIAALGVDYAAGRELDKLTRLGRLCLTLIAASLFLSILLAALISQRMSAPLRQLHDAAGQVGNGDLNAEVNIAGTDEFGLLGRTFNQMLGNIRRSMRKLGDKNQQLATVVSDMHDGVGSVLTSIALMTDGSKKQPDEAQLEPINRLSRQGLAEVRFLMDALDYDECDRSLIFVEVENLAMDILAPSRIQYELKVHGNPPQQEIPFADFLNLQRVFREAFTNIIKHSGADHCLIEFSFSDFGCKIKIQDNGGGCTEITPSGGRGLNSIRTRIKRLGGTVRYVADAGFVININLPLTAIETPP